jgi:general secretion pathway protein G
MPTATHDTRPGSKSHSSRQAGFTLLELMVIIVILGVLAGLVVPRLMDQPDKARQVKAKMQIESLSLAVQQYKLETGKYPSTQQGLSILVPEYLPSLPKDPWDNAYNYKSPGEDNHDFEIVSHGADGKTGGDDENQDIESWNIN